MQRGSDGRPPCEAARLEARKLIAARDEESGGAGPGEGGRPASRELVDGSGEEECDQPGEQPYDRRPGEQYPGTNRCDEEWRGEATRPRLGRRALHQSTLATAPLPRYAPAVATILLCGVDVYFRGKLEALLPGHHFVTSDSADWPDLVIADISRVDPDDVADSYPDVPIVGFSGHTDTAGLRRAHEAGFDQVLVKNALQERAPQVVEELIASVE